MKKILATKHKQISFLHYIRSGEWEMAGGDGEQVSRKLSLLLGTSDQGWKFSVKYVREVHMRARSTKSSQLVSRARLRALEAHGVYMLSPAIWALFWSIL